MLYFAFCLLLFSASLLSAQPAGDASLTWNQRWDNYIDRTYNWKRIGFVAVDTAFDSVRTDG